MQRDLLRVKRSFQCEERGVVRAAELAAPAQADQAPEGDLRPLRQLQREEDDDDCDGGGWQVSYAEEDEKSADSAWQTRAH